MPRSKIIRYASVRLASLTGLAVEARLAIYGCDQVQHRRAELCQVRRAEGGGQNDLIEQVQPGAAKTRLVAAVHIAAERGELAFIIGLVGGRSKNPSALAQTLARACQSGQDCIPIAIECIERRDRDRLQPLPIGGFKDGRMLRAQQVLQSDIGKARALPARFDHRKGLICERFGHDGCAGLAHDLRINAQRCIASGVKR